MTEKFTNKEKREFHFKKYFREHLFNLILNIVIANVLVVILLYICKAQTYWIGNVFTTIIAILLWLNDMRIYKKDYLDVDYPKDKK